MRSGRTVTGAVARIRLNVAVLLLALWGGSDFAHATFSIVAVDSATGAVGSAGASCISGADIIERVAEGVGAINTQAFWNGTNQAHADSLIRAGDTPDSIIGWLSANDAQNDGLDERDRQYGVVTLAGPGASASWTGTGNSFWAGHLNGAFYAIQGNILFDSTIVHMMETAFLSTPGPLESRLMATLQAAKVQGADVRCFAAGKSSISAFIKVVHPGDGPTPYLDLIVPNTTGSTDPIDLLQDEFDAWRATQIADPDLSTVAVTPAGLPALASDTAVVSITPLNSLGQPISKGGAVTLVNSGSGTLLAVRDHGDGSYSAEIVAGATVETDTIRATVDAGGQTVELTVTAQLLYFLCGDVNEDGSVTSGDIIYMVNHVFKGGEPPRPVPASGDVDRSSALTSADIIFLVTFVFKSGTAPCQ